MSAHADATITVTLDAELVERFKQARDARRAAGRALDAGEEVDSRAVVDAEKDAAHWLALHVANMADGKGGA